MCLPVGGWQGQVLELLAKLKLPLLSGIDEMVGFCLSAAQVLSDGTVHLSGQCGQCLSRCCPLHVTDVMTTYCDTSLYHQTLSTLLVLFYILSKYMYTDIVVDLIIHIWLYLRREYQFGKRRGQLIVRWPYFLGNMPVYITCSCAIVQLIIIISEFLTFGSRCCNHVAAIWAMSARDV